LGSGSKIVLALDSVGLPGTDIDFVDDLGIPASSFRGSAGAASGQEAQVPLPVRPGQVLKGQDPGADDHLRGIPFEINIPVASRLDWKAYRFPLRVRHHLPRAGLLRGDRRSQIQRHRRRAAEPAGVEVQTSESAGAGAGCGGRVWPHSRVGVGFEMTTFALEPRSLNEELGGESPAPMDSISTCTEPSTFTDSGGRRGRLPLRQRGLRQGPGPGESGGQGPVHRRRRAVLNGSRSSLCLSGLFASVPAGLTPCRSGLQGCPLLPDSVRRGRFRTRRYARSPATRRQNEQERRSPPRRRDTASAHRSGGDGSSERTLQDSSAVRSPAAPRPRPEPYLSGPGRPAKHPVPRHISRRPASRLRHWARMPVSPAAGRVHPFVPVQPIDVAGDERSSTRR